MFKDQFTLNKNSWHARLMKYMWNIRYYEFTHICPYFWLSVLNVLLFIPVAIVKEPIRYTGKFLFWIRDGIDRVTEESKEVKRLRREERDRVESQAAQMIREKIEKDDNFFTEFLETIAKWQYGNQRCVPQGYAAAYNTLERYMYYNDFNDDEKEDADSIFAKFKQKRAEIWKKYQEDEAVRLARFEEARQAQLQRNIARKKQIAKLANIAKPIGKVFLILVTGIIVLVVGYFLYLLILLLGKVPANVWTDILMWAGIVVGIVLTVFGLFFGLKFLFAKISTARFSIPMSCEQKEKWNKVGNILATPLLWLGQATYWLVMGIGKIFAIIGQMIKNNCPAVKWED